MCVLAMVCMWRSEKNLPELDLSLYSMANRIKPRLSGLVASTATNWTIVKPHKSISRTVVVLTKRLKKFQMRIFLLRIYLNIKSWHFCLKIIKNPCWFALWTTVHIFSFYIFSPTIFFSTIICFQFSKKIFQVENAVQLHSREIWVHFQSSFLLFYL